MQVAEAELEKLSYIEHWRGRGLVWRPRYCKKCQACDWCTGLLSAYLSADSHPEGHAGTTGFCSQLPVQHQRDTSQCQRLDLAPNYAAG